MYDAGGALAAEYSTLALPTNPTTSYLTTDHLGSPRVITDTNGQVISRRDFMPFGEELGVGAGPRTESLKYSVIGSDRIRQRFTGYEKDDETGLDFAEARMYQSRHGRFSSPDPLLGSASAANPQTFNRYVYTGNDPVNRTDPSGLQWCRNSDGTVKFTGVGNACGSDQTDVTGAEGTVSEDSCFTTGGNLDCYLRGAGVRFNSDGSTTQTSPPPANAAIAQGEVVANGTVEVSATSAEEAAAAGSGGDLTVGSTEIATTISTPAFAPCPAGALGCGGSAGSPQVDLTPGATAEEVLDTVQTGLDLAGLIPGIGEPADAVSAVISFARGDKVGAALSIGALIPFAGDAAGAAKIARRAGRLGNDATRSHVADIASTLIDRGYKIDGGGGRQAEEYLRPLLGGRKGGSFVDITATHPKYGTLRINTVDTLKNGITPTARELTNAARIRKQIGPGQHLLLIPKRR